MLYGPVIQKLLGIPDSVTQPTAYHLLDLDPRHVTPQLVDRALSHRKRQLRQNIPGPQFIPVVALIEKDLDRAATLLRDPTRREAYHTKLRRQSKQQPSEQGVARLIADRAREIIQQAVNADGTLAEVDRPVLVDHLRQAGLPEMDIETLLSRIPKPATASVGGDEAAQFLAVAIDQAIEQNLLAPSSEAKLLELASRLNIARDDAMVRINRRLAERGARRGRPSASDVARRFAEQVRAMHPDGQITPVDRSRLLALGRYEGLTGEQADAILLQSRAAPVPAEGDADEIYNIIHEEETEPTPAGGQWIWSVLIPLLAMVALGLAWVAIDTLGRDEPAASTAEAPAPERPAPIPVHVRVSNHLLGVAGDPVEVQRTIRGVDGTLVSQALSHAADQFWQGSPSQAGRAQQLFATLLGTPMPPDMQHLAVSTLADSITRAPADQPVWMPVRLLSSAMQLQPAPSEPVATPPQREQFVRRIELAWEASRRRSPGDPLGDPTRLAEAAAEGGDLVLVASRTSAGNLASALERLAAMASASGGRHASGAMSALDALATGQRSGESAPESLRQAALLALVGVLRDTTVPDVAERARISLLSALSIGPADPLRSAAIGDGASRRRLADQFESAITPGGRATPVATTANQPAAPRASDSDTSTDHVRDAFSNGVSVAPALADVAIALLATYERAGRFAGGSGGWRQELGNVLAAPNAVGRLSALAGGGQTQLPRVPTAGVQLDATQLQRLGEMLGSQERGERYAAIDELARADTPEAARVLLAGLQQHSQAAGDAVHIRTCARILRGLRRMSSNEIPGRLAGMILNSSSSYVASQIVVTLLAQGHARVLTDEAMLPPAHSREQRARTARWWQQRIDEGHLDWKPQAIDGVPAVGGVDSAWRPDEVNLRLLSVAGEFARLTGQTLAEYRWDRRGAGAVVQPRNMLVAVQLDGDATLADALDAVATQLDRLVREHSAGREFSVRADVVQLRRKARTLASDTELQRAVVAAEAAGGALELLVVEHDPKGQIAARLREIRESRDKQARAAGNVLVELRSELYHNLLLWDLLLAEVGP